MTYDLLYYAHYWLSPDSAPWPVAGLMLGAAGWLVGHLYRIATR
jgi:hypothetical protein